MGFFLMVSSFNKESIFPSLFMVSEYGTQVATDGEIGKLEVESKKRVGICV